MKGQNCNVYRVGFCDFYEKNRDTAEWRSERLNDQYESNKADMDMVNDIFECTLDIGVEKYANNMVGINF